MVCPLLYALAVVLDKYDMTIKPMTQLVENTSRLYSVGVGNEDVFVTVCDETSQTVVENVIKRVFIHCLVKFLPEHQSGHHLAPVAVQRPWLSIHSHPR